MLLSIVYRFVRCLLGLIAVLARQDLSKDAELLVLGQENTVLRRQVARVHDTPTDRAWLAAFVPARAASALGRDLRRDCCHHRGLTPHTGLTQGERHATYPDVPRPLWSSKKS
jgi:hypothetical protein